MKILDGRLRPPYGTFKKHKFFSEKEWTRGFNGKFGMGYSQSAVEESMDLLFAEMEEAGIVKGLTPLRRIPGMECINDDFASLNATYPDKFIGFVGLNPHIGVNETIAEIDKYVTNGSFTGINLEPGLPTPTFWLLNNPEFYPIVEKCEKEDIPVYITWGGLSQPFYIMDPKIIDEVARTFPKLKMFLAHAGFPYASENCVLAMNHRNVYLGIDLYIINAPGEKDYITAANYRCSHKICFGSAYPYNTLKGAVDWYKQSGIRKEVWEDIFYNNAARFAGVE